MSGALRTMMSGRDNVSIDVGRVLFAAAIAAVIGLETFAVVWRAQSFDPVQFGGAIASLLIAGGASLAVKGHTEPEEHHS